MPEQLRVYVSYDELLASELKAILGDLESAYNQTNVFLRHKKRVSKADRLRVASVYTGRSIDTILNGDTGTIVALVTLIAFLLKQRHVYWQTEKTKFEAKLAEKKLQSAESQEDERRIHDAVVREDKSILKAVRSLQKLFRLIDRSKRIRSIEITLKVEDETPDFTRPKRQITFEDE